MRTAVGPHPTRHLQDIPQIVDCIYAAACGEAAWDRALAEVSRVGRLDGCGLSTIDRLERRRLVLASYGLAAAQDPMHQSNASRSTVGQDSAVAARDRLAGPPARVGGARPAVL